MDQRISPSADLLAARRTLEDIAEVKLLDDWVWNQPSRRWILHSRLTPGFSQETPIPASTDWYVQVDPAYPWGSIRFFPANQGGITQTFQHQKYNQEGRKDIPWRSGEICLTTNVRALGRREYDIEPCEPDRRLHWYFERALDWLRAAAENSLALPGEPFELPPFPIEGRMTVAFSENAETFSRWQTVDHRVGFVDLLPVMDGSDLLFTRRFRSEEGQDILIPRWGNLLGQIVQEPFKGIWIRLDQLPLLPPWQPPATWEELREACGRADVDVQDLIRRGARYLRDGKPHVALLGFPISDRIGEAPVCMHWQAMWLPIVSYGKVTAKGFRPNETGYWQRDQREVFSLHTPLVWLTSENWDVEQISTRGRLPSTVTSFAVLLIGAGALGSMVAELLVRGGVQKLTLIDGDVLEAGNLVRHTLGLAELGHFKSKAVGHRLSLLSPHATIRAMATNFPPTDALEVGYVQECPLILDTTGEDAVLRHLAMFPWNEEKLILSLSFGMGARRLFCFANRGTRFPESRFRELIRPWLEQEIKEQAGHALPREGIGCWHPVFPARVDDVSMLAAAGIKYIETALATSPTNPELVVFEQCHQDQEFVGIRKLRASS